MIDSAVVWTAGEGPYVLTGDVEIRSLRIGAGTVVCGAAGARLMATELEVAVTPGSPVVLRAVDPSEPWG